MSCRVGGKLLWLKIGRLDSVVVASGKVVVGADGLQRGGSICRGYGVAPAVGSVGGTKAGCGWGIGGASRVGMGCRRLSIANE